MRRWLIWLLLGVGLILVLAGAGNGRDNTGKAVRAQAWADDVCTSVSAWQGELKDIRKELQKSSYGARNSDGGSGDAVEGTVAVKEAVDRAAIATKETLRRGLQRAGVPDSPRGAQAAVALRTWALQTEADLLAASATLEREPASGSVAAQAFGALSASVGALTRSVVRGQAAFRAVATLDPALGDAFSRSATCRRLQRRTP